MCICSGSIYENKNSIKCVTAHVCENRETCTEQFGICKQVTINGTERVLHILLQCRHYLRANPYSNKSIFLYKICFYDFSLLLLTYSMEQSPS